MLHPHFAKLMIPVVATLLGHALYLAIYPVAVTPPAARVSAKVMILGAVMFVGTRCVLRRPMYSVPARFLPSLMVANPAMFPTPAKHVMSQAVQLRSAQFLGLNRVVLLAGIRNA